MKAIAVFLLLFGPLFLYSCSIDDDAGGWVPPNKDILFGALVVSAMICGLRKLWNKRKAMLCLFALLLALSPMAALAQGRGPCAQRVYYTCVTRRDGQRACGYVTFWRCEYMGY